MNIAKTYGDYVRRVIETDPAKAGKRIRNGLYLEAFRIKHFSDKRMPEAYRYLNYNGIKRVADALSNPETLAYTNIFAPVEILQGFGLTCVSMECLSSYLSGFYLENTLIDYAESEGIAATLCSYHRNFIGAMDAGILPLPAVGVTTSTVCDGNFSTFHRLQQGHGVPCSFLDIPYEYSPEAEQYVVDQLKELITFLSETTGKRFDPDDLKERLARENRTKKYFLSYLEKRKTHAYPSTLTLTLFQLFVTHLHIGMDWAEECFRMMDEEVENYPLSDEKRIFWIHLEPYMEETLRKYFNYGDRITIAGGDFDLDYIEPLDPDHPLESLARKLICNIYNGDFSRKTKAVEQYIKWLDPDGVIELCTWGCKQSSGGVQLMKDMVHGLGKPMLVLDGDGIDRRNCPDGQIRTRFEAFLEQLGVPLLAKEKEG